jgi:hypothetical protein
MFSRGERPVGDTPGIGSEEESAGRFLKVGQVSNLSFE